MPLTTFFDCHMPYGIKKTPNGEWFAFNREYLPLGWHNKSTREDINEGGFFPSLPISAKFKGLTEKNLLELAHGQQDGKGISRNDAGEIDQIWFYNDGTNPKHDPKHWEPYMTRLKRLCNYSLS